jgi:mevalonate kinase
MYHLHLSTRGEMEFAYLGEVTTPSKCGRMDQGCAYGSVPIAMTFDRDILRVDRVDLTAPLHLVLVDLGASKCTTTILQSLQAHYPTPLDDHGQRLQQLLGEFNLRVTGDALSAMAAGDLQQLGALMREAQEEFDAAAGAVCPQQLAAPVLHQVLQHPPLQVRTVNKRAVGGEKCMSHACQRLPASIWCIVCMPACALLIMRYVV